MTCPGFYNPRFESGNKARSNEMEHEPGLQNLTAPDSEEFRLSGTLRLFVVPGIANRSV